MKPTQLEKWNIIPQEAHLRESIIHSTEVRKVITHLNTTSASTENDIKLLSLPQNTEFKHFFHTINRTRS